MFLNEIKINSKSEVLDIPDNEFADKQRLYDLGITPGTEIKSLYASPSGRITAYLVRGTVFALRDDTACKIMIKG